MPDVNPSFATWLLCGTKPATLPLCFIMWKGHHTSNCHVIEVINSSDGYQAYINSKHPRNASCVSCSLPLSPLCPALSCLCLAESKSEVAQLSPTLWDPTDCSLPGFSVHGIFQARVLGWVAFSFSRGPSQSNPGLLHYRQMLYRLSHQGSLCLAESYSTLGMTSPDMSFSLASLPCPPCLGYHSFRSSWSPQNHPHHST